MNATSFDIKILNDVLRLYRQNFFMPSDTTIHTIAKSFLEAFKGEKKENFLKLAEHYFITWELEESIERSKVRANAWLIFSEQPLADKIAEMYTKAYFSTSVTTEKEREQRLINRKPTLIVNLTDRSKGEKSAYKLVKMGLSPTRALQISFDEIFLLPG